MKISLMLACLLLFSLNGCGSSDSKPSPAAETEAPTEASPPASDVEIVWQAPHTEVDGFVIYYGYDEGALDNEVRVTVLELDSFSDPDFGKVFRYILRGIKPESTIYVAIASSKGGDLSPRSSTMVIEPN